MKVIGTIVSIDGDVCTFDGHGNIRFRLNDSFHGVELFIGAHILIFAPHGVGSNEILAPVFMGMERLCMYDVSDAKRFRDAVDDRIVFLEDSE